MSDIAPAYRDPLLHFDALRHVARPEGGRTEETFAANSEKENAYTRTCAYTLSPRSSLLLETACCPLPARSANWIDGPCFGALLYVFEEKFLALLYRGYPRATSSWRASTGLPGCSYWGPGAKVFASEICLPSVRFPMAMSCAHSGSARRSTSGRRWLLGSPSAPQGRVVEIKGLGCEGEQAPLRPGVSAGPAHEGYVRPPGPPWYRANHGAVVYCSPPSWCIWAFFF